MSWSFFFGGGGGCDDLWFFIGHLHLSAQFWSVLAHTHYLTFNTLLLSVVGIVISAAFDSLGTLDNYQS